jgi:hypothetical protein
MEYSLSHPKSIATAFLDKRTSVGESETAVAVAGVSDSPIRTSWCALERESPVLVERADCDLPLSTGELLVRPSP